ncbi:DDE-type integrase/transposase/recombinase, partial [Sinomonas mesophila]|uniref:DDE-type integrase/transposase/recombinase n=1 Tax=Sinomonas mesophila TaxID=1531955 RepID=UPI00098732E3
GTAPAQDPAPETPGLGRVRQLVLNVVADLAAAGWAVRTACALAGISHATWYRSLSPSHAAGVMVPHRERAYPNRITPAEQEAFLAELNSPAHAHLSVTQAWHRIMDAGTVLCSLASAHRIAARAGQNGDRRAQRPRGNGTSRPKPVHEATAPGQLWSWDITMLRGPGRETYRLYTVMDVFSRRVMAHRVEPAETAAHAAELIRDAVAAAPTPPTVLHSDNGTPMRAGTTVDLAQSLGITVSYSRPRVSNDNPYSEALFRTVKYDLGFPPRFTGIQHARGHTTAFFHDYNTSHRHSGLNY